MSRAGAAAFAGVTVNTIINWQREERFTPRRTTVLIAAAQNGGSGLQSEGARQAPSPEVAMRSREPGETAAARSSCFGTEI